MPLEGGGKPAVQVAPASVCWICSICRFRSNPSTEKNCLVCHKPNAAMAAAAAKQAANEIAKQRQADPKEVPGFEEWMKGYFGRQASCQLPKGAPDEVQLLSVAPNAASFSVAFTSSTKRTVTATLHIPSSSGVSPAASPSSSSSSSASSPASSAMSLEEEDADSLVHADDPIFTLVAGEQLSKLQAAYDKQNKSLSVKDVLDTCVDAYASVVKSINSNTNSSSSSRISGTAQLGDSSSSSSNNNNNSNKSDGSAAAAGEKKEDAEAAAAEGGWDDLTFEEDGKMAVDDSYAHWKRLESRWLAKEAELRKKQGAKANSAEAKAVAQIFHPSEVTKILINALLSIMKEKVAGAGHAASGILVEAVDDNVFHWRLKLKDFPFHSKLYGNLAALESKYGAGHNAVILDVKFDMNLFPFYPPSVRPVWPRLENFFMIRIVCMDELMVNKWNPFGDLTNIFRIIKKLMAQFGEVDVNNPANDPRAGNVLYTETEYQIYRLSMLVQIPPRINTLLVDHSSAAASSPTSLPSLERQLSEAEQKAASRFASWSHSAAVQKEENEILQYVTYMAQQKKKETEIRTILGLSLKDLAAQSGSMTPVFVNMLEASCMIPFIETYLARAER